MIKAVIFDLFETLITEVGTAPPRASSLGEPLGLDPRAFRAEWRARRPLVVRGQLSFERALVEIGMHLGPGVDASAVRGVCDERIRAKAAVFQRIEPDLVALTRDLCRQGIGLAVISNCFAEDVQGWSGCALAPQFTCAVFSFAVGVAKPDSRIYLKATDQLGVKPADALYIGDGGDGELIGAEGAGLRTAQAMWFLRHRTDPSGSAPAMFPRVSSRQDVLQLIGDD